MEMQCARVVDVSLPLQVLEASHGGGVPGICFLHTVGTVIFRMMVTCGRASFLFIGVALSLALSLCA